MDQHLQHRREILRAIIAGENSFEDAVRLVKQNPILVPIRSDLETFRPMFSAGGNSGIFSIWNVNLLKQCELLREATRVTTDFSEEIERASTDYYLFVGLTAATARKIINAAGLGRVGTGRAKYRWKDIWRIEGDAYVPPCDWSDFKAPLLKTSELPQKDEQGRKPRTWRRHVEKNKLPVIRLPEDINRVRASEFSIAQNYV